MGPNQQETAKQQIGKLLTIIISAIAFACVFAVFMVYFYGPTGRYYVKNALISPELVEDLSYNDKNTKTGGTSLFTFEDMVFSYYDKNSQQWQKLSIDQASYAKLYQKISDEKSLTEVSEDILSVFNRTPPASLVISVSTESQASWQKMSKNFQEVQFANQGDYFRIQLHEQNSTDAWVYFFYPKIYDEALKILTKK